MIADVEKVAGVQMNEPAAGDAERIAVEIGALMTELLAVDQIDLDDDLFELGVTSVTAVLFVAALEKRFGVSVDLAEVYERPRLREFAAYFSQLRPGEG